MLGLQADANLRRIVDYWLSEDRQRYTVCGKSPSLSWASARRLKLLWRCGAVAWRLKCLWLIVGCLQEVDGRSFLWIGKLLATTLYHAGEF